MKNQIALAFVVILLVVTIVPFTQAEVQQVTSGDAPFSLGSWLKHTWGLDLFFDYSIVGDARSCDDYASKTFTNLQAGSYTVVQMDNYCDDGNGLIDVYVNGWNPYKEWGNDIGFTCTTANAPCNIEVYCCPYAWCSDDDDCEDWVGGGSTCERSTERDRYITLDFNSWTWCTDEESVDCWYIDNGQCNKRTYNGQTECPPTYQEWPLYDSLSECNGQRCTSGQCQGSSKYCNSGRWTNCPSGQTCSNGVCSGSCTPQCSGKACGASDGCGGTCQTGSCPSGQTCSNGQCISGGGCGSGCPSGQACVNNQCITNSNLISQLNQYKRPLVGGLGLQFPRNSGYAQCSLGSIVTVNGKEYILTAGHCVTKGSDGFPDPEDIGLRIKQGGSEVGSVYCTDFTGGIDAAIISIDSGTTSQHNDFLGNSISGFGTVSNGLRVYKIGIGSGLTYGTITNTNMFYRDKNGNNVRAFEVTGDGGQFSVSGDSGAAVVTVSEPHRIVGILSAGTGSSYGQDISSFINSCQPPTPQSQFQIIGEPQMNTLSGHPGDSIPVSITIKNVGTISGTYYVEAGIAKKGLGGYAIGGELFGLYSTVNFKCCQANEFYDGKKVTLGAGQQETVTLNPKVPNENSADPPSCNNQGSVWAGYTNNYWIGANACNNCYGETGHECIERFSDNWKTFTVEEEIQLFCGDGTCNNGETKTDCCKDCGCSTGKQCDELSNVCVTPPPVAECGDGQIDTGEQCDGTNLNGNSCTGLGYDSGSLSCSSYCLFNVDNCVDNTPGPDPEGGELCIEFANNIVKGITKQDNCQTNTLIFFGGVFVLFIVLMMAIKK